jgi:hypothetical protein
MFSLRYEDLRLTPYPLLEKMFAFMLDIPTIEGTVIEARLQEVCKTDNTTKSRYVLKSNSTNLSRNRHLYDDELITHI